MCSLWGRNYCISLGWTSVLKVLNGAAISERSVVAHYNSLSYTLPCTAIDVTQLLLSECFCRDAMRRSDSSDGECEYWDGQTDRHWVTWRWGMGLVLGHLFAVATGSGGKVLMFHSVSYVEDLAWRLNTLYKPKVGAVWHYKMTAVWRHRTHSLFFIFHKDLSYVISTYTACVCVWGIATPRTVVISEHNTSYNTTQHNIQKNTTQYNTTQYNTTQQNTTQRNTTQHQHCNL
jgi:hypothetical protein